MFKTAHRPDIASGGAFLWREVYPTNRYFPLCRQSTVDTEPYLIRMQMRNTELLRIEEVSR